jgi:hypothetical protein
VAKQRHTGTFIFGALVGGLAAAGYTLWKTPQSGASLRAAIAERAEGLLDRVSSLGERIGIETGPEHDYPPAPPPAPSSAPQASTPEPTTVEPGEGPIADNEILPVDHSAESTPSASL